MVGAIEGPEHAPVLLVADVLGQVLEQRAPQRDVDQLHSPADTQHRHVVLDRRTRERDFKGVALGHGVDRLRVALLGVAAGIDVGAACEHQPVEEPEGALGLVHKERIGGKDQRDPPRALYGIHVVDGKQRGALVPGAPAGALERRADAYHRSSHAPHHRINARRRRADAAGKPSTSPRTDREESHERADHRARDGERARRRRRGNDRAEPATGPERMERPVRRRPAGGSAPRCRGRRACAPW